MVQKIKFATLFKKLHNIIKNVCVCVCVCVRLTLFVVVLLNIVIFQYYLYLIFLSYICNKLI